MRLFALSHLSIPFGRCHNLNGNLPVAVNNIRRIDNRFGFVVIIMFAEKFLFRFHQGFVRFDRFLPLNLQLRRRRLFIVDHAYILFKDFDNDLVV